MSTAIASNVESHMMCYPVRKDILDRLNFKEISELEDFICDLLNQVSVFENIWNPAIPFDWRKKYACFDWMSIQVNIEAARWGDLLRGNLIANASAIFLDQRHQYYLDFIKYGPEKMASHFTFLEEDAPRDYKELFQIVLEDRLIYPEAGILRKPDVMSDNSDSDWSDNEEDIWTRMEPREHIRPEEPRYSTYEDDCLVSIIEGFVPVLQDVERKMAQLGRAARDAIYSALDGFPPSRTPATRASPIPEDTPIDYIEMDVLDSDGRKSRTSESSEDQVTEREQPRPSFESNNRSISPSDIEVVFTREGRPFYLNHRTKTTSWDNPMEAGVLPPGWEQKANGQGKIYYFNQKTQETTWLRPMHF